MIVVEEVLVVGVGMDRLNMTADDAELIFNHTQDRHDGVRRAGGGRKDPLLGGVEVAGLLVDAVNDVGDITLARRGQKGPVAPPWP